MIQSTLVQISVTGVNPKWSGTVPLAGDWDILRMLLIPGLRGSVNLSTRFGVRLATEVPSSSAEWNAAERLWYGDSLTGYAGDGFVVPGDYPIVCEGPFRVKPRGRRVVVQFIGGSVGAQNVAITFVLRQL